MRGRKTRQRHSWSVGNVQNSRWEPPPPARSQVSNHYAAMPSMHFGYAVWVCTALVALLRGGPFHPRSPWTQRAGVAGVALYPAAVLFCILVRSSPPVRNASAPPPPQSRQLRCPRGSAQRRPSPRRVVLSMNSASSPRLTKSPGRQCGRQWHGGRASAGFSCGDR